MPGVKRKRKTYMPDRPVHEQDERENRPYTRQPNRYSPQSADEEWSEYAFEPMEDELDEEGAPPLFLNAPQLEEREPPRHGAAWFFVSILCLVLLGGMAYYTYGAWLSHAGFIRQRDEMSRTTLFEGIYIDGVPLGGLSEEQAQLKLTSHGEAGGEQLNLTLKVNGQSWLVTNEQVPFERNTERMVQAAYAVGRQGFAWVWDTGLTPFEARYRHTLQAKTDKAYLNTTITYDPAAVRSLVQQIAEQVNKEPVNAVVATFDYHTRAFTVTQDVKGARLNADGLYAQVISALDRRDYSAVIQGEAEVLMPKVTSVELQNGFGLLSACTTKTNTNENRNMNISLAAQAVNGTCIMPGESFSFNGATGERSPDKGYLPAPAIADGSTVDEPGGGVCQVSSTLMNAAAKADMTLTNRVAHAWPASYIDMGLDATVNWPGLDFTLRNDKQTPVFIVAYYAKKKLTVELYGMKPAPGESIELETELISTTNPPSGAIYVQNTALPNGTEQEKKKARTGYVVDTYRVYYRNGEPYRRELLFTSKYRAIQQLIEYH